MKALRSKTTIAIVATAIVAIIVGFIGGMALGSRSNLKSTEELSLAYQNMQVPQEFKELKLKDKENIAAIIRVDKTNCMYAISKVGFGTLTCLGSNGKMQVMTDLLKKQISIVSLLTPKDLEQIKEEAKQKSGLGS